MRVRHPLRRGFSLIEVLVAALLLGFGIVATLECLSSITASQMRTLESERMQRLAIRKYHELLALNELSAGQADGDFLDIGEERYTWHADRIATGTTNLDSLRVQVFKKGKETGQPFQVEGLICKPATTGGGQ